MRYSHRHIALLGFLLLTGPAIFAQSKTITTIAGTGTSGFSGDGGPATAAVFNQLARIVCDAAGNKYVSDGANNRIRKITPSGTITTYAGNGAPGFGGDGGTAIGAMLYNPVGLALDAAGNLYIADQNNYRIRKVTPLGTISTVAGNGTAGSSGDGGPATAAGVAQVGGVAVDAAGNLYIAGLNHRIRKVTTTGTISTIAGTGVSGHTGDGGPATLAQLSSPWDIKVDAAGNIFVTELWSNYIRKISAGGIISTVAGDGTTTYTGDGGPATAAGVNAPDGLELDAYGNIYFGQWTDHVVRKIHTSGIITTFAGTGISGYSGDGGPATAAQLNTPRGISFDSNGEMYIADSWGWIRKIAASTVSVAGSFSIDCNVSCTAADIAISTSTWSPGMTVLSYFGDGTSVTTGVAASATGVGGFTSLSHSYSNNGTYTIKHVLMSGTTPTDSVSHTVVYRLCNTISVNYYLDNNVNCTYEAGSDFHVFLPITAEIDSNGTPVDTIVTPGGFEYKAFGVAGDVYAIKILSSPVGLVLNCPSTGIISNTITATASTSIGVNNFGFNCSSVTGFDIRAHYISKAGRHGFLGMAIVDNLYCTPQPATLTIKFSDKYPYYGSDITPTAHSVNSASWDFGGLTSSAGAPIFVAVYGEKTSLPWYMMGDTANSGFRLNPEAGDMDGSNNSGEYTDSVTSSYDPNFIDVTPAGCITSAPTKLQYAVGFENTGNDTAYNIYIMDTLPAYLDISTLKVISASAFMNLTKIKYGSQVILKFDFPNIMLPDSSHHDFCHGLVIYEINTKAGIADNTTFTNRAGIYFDTNPVVMTNGIDNTVNCPISVSATDVARDRAVSVYPNPAFSELHIDAGATRIESFTVSNQLGQVMQQSTVNIATPKVDISGLPAGVYYINVKTATGNVVKKFVKM